MYFLVLFVVVFLFLTFLAWRFPAQWPGALSLAGMSGQGGRQGNPGSRGAEGVFARVIEGERKEDMPCLTPIDCVQSGKCAGHCGRH